MTYDKKYFKIFENNNKLVYLDSAATAQRPGVVVDAEVKFYEELNANADRGVCELSSNVSRILSDSRKKVADFINADNDEVVFTSGATAGVYLLANSLGKRLENTSVVITDI